MHHARTEMTRKYNNHHYFRYFLVRQYVDASISRLDRAPRTINGLSEQSQGNSHFSLCSSIAIAKGMRNTALQMLQKRFKVLYFAVTECTEQLVQRMSDIVRDQQIQTRLWVRKFYFMLARKFVDCTEHIYLFLYSEQYRQNARVSLPDTRFCHCSAHVLGCPAAGQQMLPK